MRHGDCHKATMEIADYWLLEKQLVHKLFKVLVPRFENFQVSYSRMYKAPREYPGAEMKVPRAILELRGNPYPPVKPDYTQNRGFIHNVLLDEAKKQYRREKYAEIAEKLTASTSKLEPKLNESIAEAKSEKTENINSGQDDPKNDRT